MPPHGTTEAPARPAPSPPAAGELPIVGRDVRRKRPPALSFLLRMDTLRRVARALSLLALDFAALFAAILTALSLKAQVRDVLDLDVVFHQTKDYVSFAFLVTALLFAKSGLYSDRAVRPGLTSIVSSLFQVTVVVLLYAIVSGKDFSSYYIFYGSLFFAVAYVSTFRFVYERVTGSVLRAAGYQRRAVLVGTGEHIEAVAHALGASGEEGINVIGFISLTPRPDNGLASLGRLDDLGEVVTEHRVDEVIIADPDFPQREAVELVDQCHQRGVVVRIAPSTMEILVHRAEFVPGQSVPLFELKPPVFEGFDYALKRSFDLVGSLLIIVLLGPLLLACALAIKLTSRGPMIYRSLRPGVGGAPFACLKFRTMYRDAHEHQSALEDLNEASGALFKIREDPRVTPVGRLLRRFSLDELPQLWNVVRGDMSLVGPRPLPQRDYDRLEAWHKKRYLVMPGITGLWQVSGRSDLDFDDLVRLDFLYLERWSVFLDLTILIKTVPAVLSRRGAF
jgi:exopolysaccharide biosynthesis polyprenyl glycosylphosphotransferase